MLPPRKAKSTERQTASQKTFSTPEEAVEAVITAAADNDTAALMQLFGPAGKLSVERMVAAGELAWHRGLLHHRGRQSPHALVDIRSASGALYAIVDEDTGALLGTVDEGRAFHHVHPGAVYLHQGEQFEVSELLLDRKIALVKKSDADYYTQPRHTTDLAVLDELDVRERDGLTTIFGDVRVTTQVVGFERKLASTQDVLDVVDLNLPEQTLTTRANN